MIEALWLTLAVIQSFVGMAWLALAKKAHWEQVMKQTAKAATRAPRSLRVLGTVALVFSLISCLMADSPSMALLVWVLLLGCGAALTALVLERRPHALRLLWPG